MRQTSHTSQRGFTLIELITVVGIIAVLLAIVTVAFGQARQQGKVKAETSQIGNLVLDMKLYKAHTGMYPPGADNCSACPLQTNNISAAAASWKVVADSLTPAYTATPDYTDQWGHPYAYDNNFRVPDPSLYTYICSMGPDGKLETICTTSTCNITNPNPQAQGDDICMFLK